MAETETEFLNLIKPDVGASKSTWGNRLNTDLDALDSNSLMERKAELTGLQNGGNTGTILDIDNVTPISLNDERFRTSVALQLYADTVIDAPDFATIMSRPGALCPVHWVAYLVDQLMPVGTIILWYGEEADIPEGWKLCDDQPYSLPGGGIIQTPDLRGRFVLGAWPDYTSPAGFKMDAGESGGTAGDLVHTHVITVANTTLTAAQIPPHLHGTNASGSDAVMARMTSGGSWDISGGGPANGYGLASISNGSDVSGGPGGQPHNHTATSAGNTEPPPYWALAYIMKVRKFYTPLP
jgi:hypothetical protein